MELKNGLQQECNFLYKLFGLGGNFFLPLIAKFIQFQINPYPKKLNFFSKNLYYYLIFLSSRTKENHRNPIY